MSLVSILMDSTSDRKIMEPAMEVLSKYNIPFEVKIISVHHIPEVLIPYIHSLNKSDTKIIITGDGMSATLPGVVASHTNLPVIGVPIEYGSLTGINALYSMSQMPSGVPIASVGINASENAALLAMRILGLVDTIFLDKYEQHVKEMKSKAVEQV